MPLANATQQESEDLMTSIDLMTFTPSPPEDLNNDATENDFCDLALVESDDNESEDDAQESNYVRTHHMFSRILNFLFVIVFSRKSCLLNKNNSYIYWHFINYFDS